MTTTAPAAVTSDLVGLAAPGPALDALKGARRRGERVHFGAKPVLDLVVSGQSRASPSAAFRRARAW